MRLWGFCGAAPRSPTRTGDSCGGSAPRTGLSSPGSSPRTPWQDSLQHVYIPQKGHTHETHPAAKETTNLPQQATPGQGRRPLPQGTGFHRSRTRLRSTRNHRLPHRIRGQLQEGRHQAIQGTARHEPRFPLPVTPHRPMPAAIRDAEGQHGAEDEGCHPLPHRLQAHLRGELRPQQGQEIGTYTPECSQTEESRLRTRYRDFPYMPGISPPVRNKTTGYPLI